MPEALTEIPLRSIAPQLSAREEMTLFAKLQPLTSNGPNDTMTNPRPSDLSQNIAQRTQAIAEVCRRRRRNCKLWNLEFSNGVTMRSFFGPSYFGVSGQLEKAAPRRLVIVVLDKGHHQKKKAA